MQRQHRLTESADFQRVRQQGRSYGHSLLVLYARSGGHGATRVGFSVGKRVGKAVVRNRVKRRLREAVRLWLPRIAPGWELVFVARPGAASQGYGQFAAVVEQGLRRAGALPSEGMPAGAPAPERGAPGHAGSSRREGESAG